MTTTPDTATLADRIEDALADTLPVMTDPENAGQTVLHYGTEPGDMEWGGAATLAARLMDAIRPLITDALAAAEQQTAYEHHDADGMLISCGDAQTALERTRAVLPDAGVEIYRLRGEVDEIRRDLTTARRERDAARAEVAELTRQRDQAMAAALPWMVQHDGDWYLNHGHPAIEKLRSILAIDGDGDYVTDVLTRWGDALAVPVPAGDTSHDETTPPADTCVCGCPKRAHQVEIAPSTMPGWYSPPIHDCINHDGCRYRLATPADPEEPAPVAAHAGQDEEA